MSKAHQLAWAAGFFDGEGYVTVQVRGGKYKGHYLRIGINHVDPKPLEEFKRLFGGNIRKQNPKTVVGNRHVRHEWGISCSLAASALKQMLPYFLNKDQVAMLGLELQETMGNTQAVSEEVLNKRQHIKEEIQRLNALD